MGGSMAHPRTTNPNAARVIDAIHQRFYAVGMNVRENKQDTILHFPHLVSFPEISPDEQRAHIDELVRGSIDEAGVEGVTFTQRDTTGRECGNKNWWQFDVQIRVPR